MRLRLVAFLLLAALGLLSSLGEASSKCQSYPPAGQKVAVKQLWTVDGAVTHFLQPGNQTLRGPAVPPQYHRVHIDVRNNLIANPITVHWHGINQNGTPWADGTAGVNSCPIMPGETYPYLWQADRPGTFLYHGHTGIEDEMGISGPIVIEDPNDPHRHLYDTELESGPIMVRDWWRSPEGQYANRFLYGFYSNLEAAIIDGQFGDGSAEFPYKVYNVTAGLCYRFRFICANSEWPGWKATIEGLNVTLIAWDAENIKPVNAKGFAFYVSTRVDAVICADAPEGDYKLTFSSIHAPSARGVCPPDTCSNTTSAIIRIVPNASKIKSTVDRKELLKAAVVYDNGGVVDTARNLRMIKPLVPTPPPAKADMTWVMYVGVGDPPKFQGFVWHDPAVPSLMPMSPAQFTQGRCGMDGIYYKTLPKTGMVVDIIFNNLMSLAHPMHQHLQRFWFLGTKYITDTNDNFMPQNQTFCPGRAKCVNEKACLPFAWGCPYNETYDKSHLNFVDPPTADGAILPPRSWSVVRVKYDSPAWAYFHCHINHHMIEGMGFLVNVAPSKQPEVPAWINTRCAACGAVKQQCGQYTVDPAKLPKCTNTKPYCNPLEPLMGGMYMG